MPLKMSTQTRLAYRLDLR